MLGHFLGRTLYNLELDMGRVDPWVGSSWVQLCEFVWVSLDDTESELLILLMFKLKWNESKLYAASLFSVQIEHSWVKFLISKQSLTGANVISKYA